MSWRWKAPLGDEKAIGSGCVGFHVIESAPLPALKVLQFQLLLGFL
jgi:hypothetical protein